MNWHSGGLVTSPGRRQLLHSRRRARCDALVPAGSVLASCTCGPQPVSVAVPGEREPDGPLHGTGID